jgi:tRNA threonylcarbamoyladenosine biosynthesis protein TsaE
VYAVHQTLSNTPVHSPKRPGASETDTTRSAFETTRCGRRFARTLRAGDVVLLCGPLGCGKTTFVKGVARGLGIADPIVSPTFVLHKRYAVPAGRAISALNHIDAYRFRSADETRGALEDALSRASTEAWCVEWGKRMLPVLRGIPCTTVTFTVVGAQKRRIRIVRPQRLRGGRRRRGT